MTSASLCSPAADRAKGVNGSTPRPHVLLETALAPLTVIVGWAFTWFMDATVRSHAKPKKA